MTRLFVAAAVFALAAPIQAQEEAPAATAVDKEVVTADGQKVDATDSAAAAIVADCSTRKFETAVEFEKEGQKRRTKLKLCAAKGEDEATWVKTLKDAKSKIAAHPEISQESKTRIATELDHEIAKIESARLATRVSTLALPENPIPPASRPPEYGVYPQLPPLPEAAKPKPATPTQEATVKPQLASPAPDASAKPKLASLPAPPPVAKPRLTVRCLESGEQGKGSECFMLARSTRLAIRADENLSGGTSLRFLRKGDIKGEIKLAGMRQGQLLRSVLPSQVCADVVSGQVEIQVMSSNRVVETLGPYKLRC